MRSSTSFIRILTLLGLTALVSACASAPPVKPPEVVWPLPPEKPRIRFVESINSSKDVSPRKRGMLAKVLTGSEGTTGMSKPYGVHVDKDGRLFVADTGWRKVLMFDKAGQDFAMFGVDGLGMLNQPVAVSSDTAGRIYVSDASQARVVVFGPDGSYVNAFGGRDYLTKPVGVAVDSERQRVYVVDTKQHEVVVFGMDGSFITRFGGQGPQEGAFNWPTNVAVGPDGSVYVVDMLNFRVQVFNPDGEFLWKFGGVGRGFGQFSKPKGIGVDARGRIFVADAAFNNVQIFDGQGRLLMFFGGMGQGFGQFWMPAGLAIGPAGRIYVADQFNRRINIYEVINYPEEEAAAPAAEALPLPTGVEALPPLTDESDSAGSSEPGTPGQPGMGKSETRTGTDAGSGAQATGETTEESQ